VAKKVELPRIVYVDFEPKHVSSTQGVVWFNYRIKVVFDREVPIDSVLHFALIVGKSVVASQRVLVPKDSKEVTLTGTTTSFTVPTSECTRKSPLIKVCRGVVKSRIGFCLTARVDGVVTQPPSCLAGYSHFLFFDGPTIEVNVEVFSPAEVEEETEKKIEKERREVPQEEFEKIIEEMRRRIEEKLPSQVREEIEKATCVLSGVVIDVVEDKPVQGAEVILMNKKTYKVYTDENGRFAIANIEPGRYKLIIKAKNYATWVREVELRSGDYLELTIAMEPLKSRVRERIGGVITTAAITATPLLLIFVSTLAKK